MTVPGYLTGWNYERAWFRRVFTLPGTTAGQQLKLKFGGVKFDAQVWLNGAFVGGYFNGYEPFELDITSAALVGQCHDGVGNGAHSAHAASERNKHSTPFMT